jgi:redox-sensitive bicupin YhaK (pirin superfamily)
VIEIRRAAERGHSDRGWLLSAHTFSFADYHDPRHTGFRQLRVINEDRVQPGRGFATHGHRDMEILSYVLAGALEHRDSLGTGSVIRPGDVQRMSAGTGVTHSEFNPSPTEPVHFLQIWILPARLGLAPSYEQRTYPEPARRGRLALIGSADGRDGSVTIHQDVGVFATLLEPGESVAHRLAPGRHAWVQVVRGDVAVNGETLRQGDGVALGGEAQAAIAARTPAEALLFDLA